MAKSIAVMSALSAVWVTVTAAQQMPQTTKEKIQGTPSVKTEKLRGTVVHVEGNILVVEMSDGNLREFVVPESRRFNIDNHEVSVHELKPGTKLEATVTTTTTPVTQRTTTIGSGTVWWVQGNNVILTLPNGENRMYKVQDSYRFNVEGRPASVHDLRKGMKIYAQKIVEEPMTELSTNTGVTGQAPPAPQPRTEVAQTPPAPQPRPAPAPVQTAPAPPPAAAAPQPANTPADRPAAQPARLPKTGSSLPLVGLLGTLFIASSLAVRTLARFRRP